MGADVVVVAEVGKNYLSFAPKIRLEIMKKLILMSVVFLMLGCSLEDKTLPNIHDGEFYNDVLLSFPLDEKSPEILRVREIAKSPDNLPIKIGLNSNTPPFVMPDEKNIPHGFTVDYWNRISQIIDRDIEFILYENLPHIFIALSNGEIDSAAGGITHTKLREESGFMFVSELRDDELGILTRAKKHRNISKEFYVILFLFLLSLIFYSMINFRKQSDKSDKFIDRSISAFHETVTVHFGRDSEARTDGKFDEILDLLQLVKGPIFISLLVTFLVVSYFNAEYEIKNLSDLSGKIVATKSGTNTFKLISGVEFLSANSLRDAVELFLEGKSDAVVHDKSMLNHYQQMAPDLFRVISIGANRSHTGFAFTDKKLATATQLAIDTIYGSGEYKMLLDGYEMDK